MPDSEQQPAIPPPGPPFIPPSFPWNADDTNTNGYVLNHVALQISSPASSLSFYVDLLGMSLIFTLNAGPFAAYYLGYREPEHDATPADMARAAGKRSGLLELIVVTDQDAKLDIATHSGTQSAEKGDGGNMFGRGRGFAHLGFRVPDVAETLRRALEKGWKVMKALDDVDVWFMPLPGWEDEPDGKEGKERRWEGGFEKTFAQVAFVQDPDG
jgi:lactoylglutathione lyase